MKDTPNSRTPTGIVFSHTSDGLKPYSDSWGQPSISHYFLKVNNGQWIIGQEITNVLPGSSLAGGGLITSGYAFVSAGGDDNDDGEMAGLVVTYNEAKAMPSDSVSLEDALREFEERRKGM